MVGIVVTGHGNFATGILSSLELIAGKVDNLVGINFTKEDSTETLEVKMKGAIKELGDEVLVLADLAGGSPFKVAAILGGKFESKKIAVISGVNLGMLLEVSLCRDGMKLDALSEMAINSGINNIKKFNATKKQLQDDEEDGI